MPEPLSAADIAEGRAKLAAATGGPWFAWDRGVGYMLALDPDGDVVLPEGGRTDLGRREDAELIVWARNHLPALLDAAEKVRALKALHSPDDGGDGSRLRCCTECLTHWPCATSRAINTGEAR